MVSQSQLWPPFVSCLVGLRVDALTGSPVSLQQLPELETPFVLSCNTLSLYLAWLRRCGPKPTFGSNFGLSLEHSDLAGEFLLLRFELGKFFITALQLSVTARRAGCS